MRKCLFLILAVLMMYSSLGDLFDYSVYQLNKDFIAEALCVNKDDAEMKCQGKCFLLSKIKENKSTNSENPITYVDVQTKWQILSVDAESINYAALIMRPSKFIFIDLFAETVVRAIFHPPQ